MSIFSNHFGLRPSQNEQHQFFFVKVIRELQVITDRHLETELAQPVTVRGATWPHFQVLSLTTVGHDVLEVEILWQGFHDKMFILSLYFIYRIAFSAFRQTMGYL